MGAEGAGRLAGVLGECKALAYLSLYSNEIDDEGVGRLAGALVECKALAHPPPHQSCFQTDRDESAPCSSPGPPPAFLLLLHQH
eukprot:2951201-Rhodomonas_salina.1